MFVSLLVQTALISSFLPKGIAAEEAHPIQHVSITIHSNVDGPATKTEAELAMNRKAGRFLLKISRYGPSGLVQARTYFLNGQSLVIFDRVRDQYVLRKLPKGKSLGQSLIANLKIEPSILVAIDPPTANAILFSKLNPSGWSRSQSGGEISYSRRVSTGGHVSTTTIGLSSANLLPTSLSFGLDQRSDSSYYRYLDIADDAHFTPPSNARQVERFSTKKSHVQVASAPVRAILKACGHAYDQIRSLVYKVDSTDGSAKIYWHGVQAKVISSKLTWAYDGTVLRIQAGSKHVKVATDPEQISQYLSPLGSRIEPSLQSLMEGNNMLQGIYTQSFTARMAGAMSIGGVPYQIVELKGTSLRIQIRIRQDNHLIGGFLTENLDSKGGLISSSQRTFTYLAVNPTLPVSTFKMQ
ncbi:MAG TPA: hypothetical protein VGL56_03855 [Fimbriimonadaceae bacterium]|jgi:hypothetical protein